jgi:hypothetical protein
MPTLSGLLHPTPFVKYFINKLSLSQDRSFPLSSLNFHLFPSAVHENPPVISVPQSEQEIFFQMKTFPLSFPIEIFMM